MSKLSILLIVSACIQAPCFIASSIITKDIPRFRFLQTGCFTFGNTMTTIDNKTPFPIEIIAVESLYWHYKRGNFRYPANGSQTGIILPGKKYKILTVDRGCPHGIDDKIYEITVKVPLVGTIVLKEVFKNEDWLPGGSGEARRRGSITDVETFASISIRSGNSYTGDNIVEEIRHDNVRTHHIAEFRKGNETIKAAFYAYATFGYDDILCELTYQKK